jgi:hypothetical protein
MKHIDVCIHQVEIFMKKQKSDSIAPREQLTAIGVQVGNKITEKMYT